MMAMKSALFHLTCVVADVLHVAKVKAEIPTIHTCPLSYYESLVKGGP